MRIRLTVPSSLVNERTLGAAAEAATEVAQAHIEQGGVPPLADLLDAGQLQWAPETSFGGRPGLESFDPPSVVMARGGLLDCDDIAPWWAAELRASQADPEAQAVVYQSGPRRFHVVVKRGDGSHDDPSRWAGMGRKEGSAPAATAPMSSSGQDTVVGFARTSQGHWRARLDVPTSSDGLIGVAVERVGLSPWDALTRAVGDITLAVMSHWGAPDDVIAKMVACNDILHNGIHPAVHPDDYAHMGPFVHELAHAVGALQMSVNPGQAADIAATIIDPLGLRNLVPGLAQSFVSNYAQGLGSKTKKKKKSDDDETTGAEHDGACPRGWHWENHGGISVCVRDESVMGDWASYKKSQQKPNRKGTKGGRGGQQEQGHQRRMQDAPADDPMQGLTFDPQSGLMFDPQGNWYDQSGSPIYAQQQQAPWFPPSPQPYQYGYPQQQPGYYPGYAPPPGYGGMSYGGGGTGPLYPY